MLYVSLVVSLVVLYVANEIARDPQRRYHPANFFAVLPLLLAMSCLGISPTAAIFTFFALALVMVPWYFGRKNPRPFLPLSLAAFAVTWAGVTVGRGMTPQSSTGSANFTPSSRRHTGCRRRRRTTRPGTGRS